MEQTLSQILEFHLKICQKAAVMRESHGDADMCRWREPFIVLTNDIPLFEATINLFREYKVTCLQSAVKNAEKLHLLIMGWTNGQLKK